jgi:hypothetical protein
MGFRDIFNNMFRPKQEQPQHQVTSLLFFQESSRQATGPRRRTGPENNSEHLGAAPKPRAPLPGGMREVGLGHRGWEPINPDSYCSGNEMTDYLRDGAAPIRS